MNDNDGNMSEYLSEEDTPTLVSNSNRPLISWSVSKGRLPLDDKGAVLEAPSDHWQRTGHKISGESMSSGELGSLDDQFNILAKRQRRSTGSEWIPSSWSQHQAWENTFQLFHDYIFSPYGFTTFIAKREAIGHQLVTLKPTIFCSHCRRHIPQSASHLSTWLKLCPNFTLAALNRE